MSLMLAIKVHAVALLEGLLPVLRQPSAAAQPCEGPFDELIDAAALRSPWQCRIV